MSARRRAGIVLLLAPCAVFVLAFACSRALSPSTTVTAAAAPHNAPIAPARPLALIAPALPAVHTPLPRAPKKKPRPAATPVPATTTTTPATTTPVAVPAATQAPTYTAPPVTVAPKVTPRVTPTRPATPAPSFDSSG